MSNNYAERVFSAQNANGNSPSVEIINAHKEVDITPDSLGVMAPSGKVYVMVKNAGAGTFVCKVEWSPDGNNWYEGVTTQEEIYANVSGGGGTLEDQGDPTADGFASGTIAANSTAVGATTRTQPDLIASNGSVVEGNTSIAQAVALKGRLCRLVISSTSGTIDVTAHIGGM